MYYLCHHKTCNLAGTRTVKDAYAQHPNVPSLPEEISASEENQAVSLSPVWVCNIRCLIFKRNVS